MLERLSVSGKSNEEDKGVNMFNNMGMKKLEEKIEALEKKIEDLESRFVYESCVDEEQLRRYIVFPYYVDDIEHREVSTKEVVGLIMEKMNLKIEFTAEREHITPSRIELVRR